MAWQSPKPICINTVKAADIIVSLLTDEEKALLDIELNGKRITVIEQLCARWGDKVPIDDNPLVFRAKAAEIIDTNKRWLKLMAKLKEDDFFMQLVDPDSYKEKHIKSTSGKSLMKRQIDAISDNVNVVKTIGRTISGTGGTNRDTDYGSAGDKSDRQRFDRMKLKRPDMPLTSQETGQEDDSRGTDEEEMPKSTNTEAGINKTERLDKTHMRAPSTSRPEASFDDDYDEIEEKKIGIFDLALNHATNSTLSDNAIKTDTLIDAQKRQGFLTLGEKAVKADTINKIHNVEFINTRDKFFRLFDCLFRRVERLCQ